MSSPPIATFATALDAYLKAHPLERKRARWLRAHYAKTLRRLVGSLGLEEAAQKAVTWRRERLAQKVVRSTAGQESSLLRRVLEHAGQKVPTRRMEPRENTPWSKGPMTTPGKPGTLQEAIQRFEQQTVRSRACRYHAAYWVRLWGSRLLVDVKPADIRAWQSELLRAGKVKPATIDAKQCALSAVFELARLEERILVNPCRAAGWLRTKAGRTRVLTEDEEASLLAALHPDLALFFRFLLATGLRAGEALGMDWRDIHESRAWIPPRKTPHGRHIPLNETALALLAQRRDLEQPWPYSYRQLAQRLSRTCARIGLEGVTLHVARHTFATRLLRSGASLLHVKRCLGHTDWSNTERYSHLVIDDLQEAVNRLDTRPTPEPQTDLAALVAQLSAQVAALTARLAG